jgi:glyoxylase-like metal-dependent hydrolase (beta-lactamase superfamily II)
MVRGCLPAAHQSRKIMKRSLVLGSIVLVGALSATVAALQQPPGGQGGQGRGRGPAQPPSAAQLQVDKLRDNLYVLRGGGGNTAVFITAGGVVLVDTKITGWGQPIIERVRELTDKPVTTIINTHTHYDHSEGNPEFPATVEVVTHENTAKLMAEMRDVYGIAPLGRNVFKESNGRGLPKRTFRDRLTLGSGNDRVELHYFGPAHTSGDAFVVFPAARVLHTGDTFPNKGMPIMDVNNGGSGLQYSGTLAKAAALPNIDTVITGHNATTVTMADVKTYSEFIDAFVSQVIAAKKAGQTIEAVAEGWKVPERFLKEGYVQPMPARIRPNVEVIWKEAQ